MSIFIPSLDYNLWDLIVDGPDLPTPINENGEKVPKPRTRYNDEDRKKVQMNAKAKHIIICSINSNEFSRVSSCVSAKEMWDRLEVTYEGTDRVKEAKINMLVHEYEMFTMHDNEDIKTMFTRFTNITNALQALDKVYTNSEMVRKILRCLPRTWMPKVTAIEEAKDLNTFPLKDLLGSLMTHEFSILKRDDEEETERKKKKVIALKSTSNEETDNESDQELALITIKFKKFLESKKKIGRKPFRKGNIQKGESSKIEEIICFECNKPGHYKSDCPRLKKKEQFKKKKAMLATWDDSDESSSDEESPEEVAQLALMAIEEEEEENDEVTYDELILIVEKYSCIISDLKKKIKILNVENNDLKKANNMLNNKDETKIKILEKENGCLKIEVDALKKTFSNFYNSSEKLEKLLGMQRCVFDKTGLGYDEMNNVKHYQNFFERKIKIEKEKVEKEIVRKPNTNVFCNYCDKKGHISSSWFYKRNIKYKSTPDFIKVKKIWVPKGIIDTNPKGPKISWIPQTKI
ncbi:zf-CCHC domain-containing protein/UBN2 domain-containing protein [Cephalotus follicularis]|uniref:Zf-CCHC domain-containing protein/UBN2 domain-containing protein n=1 Tax=Cephalotus follicularis TaxID=3775 RepID=A0A1Q3BLB0_CEPFO|nr:zf-CCHC domain-containing protein/UBN2 domain-containing protein [Cephalotus follicularis]